MKIRTQFIFTLSVFWVVLIVMTLSLFLTNRRVEHLRQQEDIAHQIERRASELNYLAGDYLMYGESQQRLRWETSFKSFSENVSRLEPANSEQQAIIADIKTNQARLRAVFDDIAAVRAGSTPASDVGSSLAFMQVSWSRVEVQNQGMAFQASLLSQKLRDEADRLKQINLVFVFVLIVIFSAYLLSNYYLIYRGALQSITELQAGAKTVGSGNLDFTVAVKREDEIGELAHAFNQMAASLKDVTASKADMEREIAERERAEAALQVANEELQVIAEELRQQNDELRHTQSALSESESKYRTLVENAPVGIYEIDLVSRKFITVNDVLCSVTGYSRQEILSMDALDLLKGDHKKKFLDRLQKMMSGQQVPGIIEYQIRLKSGEVRWALLNVNFTLTNGIPVLARVTATDITERKKAEEALQDTKEELQVIAEELRQQNDELRHTQSALSESESKYRNLFENMVEEVHFWQLVRDEAGQIRTWRLVDANPPTLKTWGRESVDEIKGKTTDEIFGPGAAEHFMPVVQKIMTEGIPFAYEDYFPNLDKYFRFTSVPLGDHFITTGADITSIKKTARALRQSEERFRLALTHAPISVASQDLDLRFTWAYNQRTRSVDEIVGKTDIDLFSLEAGHLIEIKRKVIETGESLSEKLWVTSNGQRLFLDLFIEPLRNELGEIEGVGIATVNLTPIMLAEEALRRNEALLQAVLDNVPDAIFLKDRDSRLLLANPATLAIIGKPAEAVLGKTDAEFYDDPATGSAIMENDRRIMESGKMEAVEENVAASPGTRVYLSTKAPYRDADGQIIGLIGIAHDITEHKRAEEALRRSEALLVETGKMAKVGGWELDLQSMRLSWTLETYHIHEVDTSIEPELEGAINFYAPEARPQITEAVRQAIEEGKSYDLELPFITAKGRNIWIRTIGQPEFRDGKCVRVFGTFQDITERKQAEAALLAAALQKQASEYARTLIEVSLDPLVTISPEGRITDVNEATVSATGVSRPELIGTNFSSYFTEPEKAEHGYRQVFAQGYATDYPLTIHHRDGHLIDVLYNASLYKDTKGNVLGAFAAARDVTAQKQAEAELKRHKDNLEILVKERTAELEESNRELGRSNENLQQFAYVASHDLQEPLRIMSSYSQLLEKRYKDRLDQDADEFIDFIVEAAARMQKLITDLLAYSRAGHEATNKLEVDCNKVVRMLVAGMSATIESVEGQVTFDKLPSIIAHESSLLQLFQNLIANALKFRGEQPPCIHMSARRSDSEWIFSVRDNGIGIEPQYRERIFMIFQRLHPRDKYPGTGIGLSICKKIVETLGGRIWVESEPGQGSTFYFSVPISKVLSE